jgi:hypothetical protein
MKKLSRTGALIVIATFVSLCARSQPPIDPQTAALMKKAEELERGLAELKAELARRGAVSTSDSTAVSIPVPEPPAMPQPANEGRTLGPLQLRGFSDLGFGRALFEKMPPAGLHGSSHSFTIGDFDLFATSQITDRLSFLGEMLITSDFTNAFAAELDRLLLTYKVNEYFRISAGKYNTAIGFYSNQFHRARFFQTATGRPMLFADEDNGGILPVHGIGVTATGKIPSGGLGLHWVAEVANGRGAHGAEPAPVQNFVDENNGKAFNLAIYARPDRLHGFQTGASFYRDVLYPEGAGRLRQSIFSGYAAFVSPHTELLAEGVLLRHSDLAVLRTFNTVSWYVQASRKAGPLRPYARYEYQNTPKEDPLFHDLGRRNGPSAGIRFDLSAYAALKLQFGRLSLRNGMSTNTAHAQVAFAF